MAAPLGGRGQVSRQFGEEIKHLSLDSCLFPKVEESKDAEPALREQQQRCVPASWRPTLGNCCRTVWFPLGEVAAQSPSRTQRWPWLNPFRASPPSPTTVRTLGWGSRARLSEDSAPRHLLVLAHTCVHTCTHAGTCRALLLSALLRVCKEVAKILEGRESGQTGGGARTVVRRGRVWVGVGVTTRSHPARRACWLDLWRRGSHGHWDQVT